VSSTPVTDVLKKRFDALVVGSGAAGSIAVKELTERGLDVLLLEAGRDITERDFKPAPETRPHPMGIDLGPRLRAALRGQHIQARRAFFRPQTNAFFVNDRENPYTTPREPYFVWFRGRQLGGRLHTYGRVLFRMSDYDFKAASRDGNGDDWPISYADLAPWYERVEAFLGIYGNADRLDQIPDGTYVGPAKLTTAEQAFKRVVETNWPERNVISWRYAAPNPHRVPLGILAARETGRLTTRTDAVVRRITVDEASGRADGAVFVDRLKKTEHRVTADVIVLCASAIESVRLLLNSACASHPDGLANSSGLLGRYFMDQCPTLLFAGLPDAPGVETDDSAPPDSFYPPAGGVFIPRFHNLERPTHSDFSRGFSFQGVLGRFPVPPGHPGAVAFMAYGETPPQRQSSITVDSKRTDAWGIPAPHISYCITDAERVVMREQLRTLREMVETAGCRVNFAGTPLGLDSDRVFPDADPISRFFFRREFRKSVAMGTAIHECGGARMGDDPAHSVLNAYNQTWDVPNLFITDGSCFVSSGTVGPTLTIMALTARACDQIARENGR
jgi:choline dehydrogenase-like flavoprotein